MDAPVFTLNNEILKHGQLVYEAKTPAIGIGAFKTAHHARLTLTPVEVEGLGTVINEPIVMKCPYINKGPEKVASTSQLRISRYGVTDELEKCCIEANILFWASSLMTMVDSFISRFIGKSANLPPFDIPKVRFVRAGLAVGQKAINNRSTARAGYLLEEYIDPMIEGPFTKYIHNGDAVPLLDYDDSGYNVAQYLCFAQHVQYEKTGQAAYVSDFQGKPFFAF